MIKYSRKQNYKKAVEKGYEGTFNRWLSQLLKRKDAWGTDRRGKLYQECVKCGTKKRPYYLRGMCYRCFEITRRDYKAMKQREYYANKLVRGNKSPKQES